jgi:cyclic beta-1,2-glucan synthetase
MAHHQGMSVVAIANTLRGGIMRTRFHDNPIVQATELLLQERPPRDVTVKWVRAEELSQTAQIRELVPPMLRRFRSPHDRIPRTHLLSNGRYAVMITAAGSGFSRWRNLAVSRWREDVTCDPWGSYVYLRDVGTGLVWSAAYQPSGARPTMAKSRFEDRPRSVRRNPYDHSMSSYRRRRTGSQACRSQFGVRTREIELTSPRVILASMMMRRIPLKLLYKPVRA